MAEATPSVAVIGIDEALDRLAAKQRANPDEAEKLLGPPKFEPSTPEIAEQLQQAQLYWMRREAAIALPDDALDCGDQRPFIRRQDGDLIPLTSAEWRAYPFRRETLISGVWRGSAGPAGLLDYDRCPVLLAEAAFQSWCERSSSSPPPPPKPEPPRYELKERPHKVTDLTWKTMRILVEFRNNNHELYTVLTQDQLVKFVNARFESRGAQAGVPVSRIGLRTLQTAAAELKRSVPGWT